MNAGNLHPTLGVMSVRLVQKSFGVPKVSRKEIIGRMNNRVLTSAALNRTGRSNVSNGRPALQDILADVRADASSAKCISVTLDRGADQFVRQQTYSLILFSLPLATSHL